MKLFQCGLLIFKVFFTSNRENLWPFEISLNQERTTLSPYI